MNVFVFPESYLTFRIKRQKTLYCYDYLWPVTNPLNLKQSLSHLSVAGMQILLFITAFQKHQPVTHTRVTQIREKRPETIERAHHRCVGVLGPADKHHSGDICILGSIMGLHNRPGFIPCCSQKDNLHVEQVQAYFPQERISRGFKYLSSYAERQKFYLVSLLMLSFALLCSEESAQDCEIYWTNASV